ncbi:MAG: hypothetical protein RBT49_01965 [Bacteroidales bacterium]|jgi:hypothetical protein|nr:hypothetical protein [Bacteroidales bacterium]
MKENLSQRKLLEVLTHEIEVLRKTSSNINEAGPIIAQRLQELKQTKLTAQVDIKDLKTLIQEHKEYIDSKTSIPTWFIVAFFIVFGILAIQSIWLYGYIFIK